MKAIQHLFILFSLCVLNCGFSQAQEQKKIAIEFAGFLTVDEETYPGAKILTRDDQGQVKISHEGVLMWCDQAIHYS